MNRHLKRKQQALSKRGGSGVPKAAVLETMGAIQDFAETVEKLKPYLSAIQSMAAQIDDCVSVIRDVELRNSELKAELVLQREVTLRLIERTAGLSAVLGDIRLLEAQIQDEILKESTPDGTPTESTEPATEQEGPGPGAEVGLASASPEGDPES